MFNYATKSAKKVDLACLKSDVDKLDIDKLENTPIDLSKPSNIIKNVAVKRLYTG